MPVATAPIEHVVAGGNVGESFFVGQSILRYVRERAPLNDVGREAFAVGGAEDRLKMCHRDASSRSISAWSAAALSAHVGRYTLPGAGAVSTVEPFSIDRNSSARWSGLPKGM